MRSLARTGCRVDFSGVPNDRWAFTTKEPRLQYGAAAALASASQALKGWDDALARQCLDASIKLWSEKRSHPTPVQVPPGWGMSKQFVEEMVRNEEWKATLQLLIATNGGEIYKKHVIDMFPEAQKRFDRGGWMSVFALSYMGPDFKQQVEAAVRGYVTELDKRLAATPFGVPPSLHGWEGPLKSIDLGVRLYFLPQGVFRKLLVLNTRSAQPTTYSVHIRSRARRTCLRSERCQS